MYIYRSKWMTCGGIVQLTMVGHFKIVDSKNAVCAPTNHDYIDSMVNKINLICTTFHSIIQGGVHWLDFIKIGLIRASIIHGGENQADLCHIRLDHPRWRKSTSFTQWRKPTLSLTPLVIGISEREGTIPQLGMVKSHFLHAMTYDVEESSRFSPPWMIESNVVLIESIFSTMDDWVECGTNWLNDRVERGSNRVDFVDHWVNFVHRVDKIVICRCTDSSFESTILKQMAHHI